MAAVLSATGEKNPELCWNVNMIAYKNILETDNNITSILDEKFEHPWFGSHYYFSSVPLNGADTTKIKRYAGFTFNGRYILRDIQEVTEEEKNAFNESLEETDTETIYFREKGAQIWCIKTNDYFTSIE